MTFWHGFWIITSVHFWACMSPGPDFVLVSQQALSRGRAAGMLTALGIALGFGIHIIYSVLGLVTLVAQSAPLLTAVKIVGGLYLLYIGYKGLRAKAAGGTVEIRKDHMADEPTRKTIWRGVLCNVLNPKAVVYMLSLFTVVLSPDTPMWQMGGLRRVDGADAVHLVQPCRADVVRTCREQTFSAFRSLDRPILRRSVGVAGD